MNISDKILYGIKVANDNIIIINDKMDAHMQMLSYDEQKEQDDASPMTDGKQSPLLQNRTTSTTFVVRWCEPFV